MKTSDLMNRSLLSGNTEIILKHYNKQVNTETGQIKRTTYSCNMLKWHINIIQPYSDFKAMAYDKA